MSAAGVSRPTVTLGVAEVLVGGQDGAGEGRVRKPGGGRKSLTETDPALLAALDALVEPGTRGDPMSPLRWTTKSTRNLADALTAAGKQHPDRDAQCRHINDTATRYLKASDPVSSVDAKNKELVGETPGYRSNGRDWQPQEEPIKVGTHDFPDKDMPKAVPYGIYDLSANTGWVTVGNDNRLLISADSGGSNRYRVRLWKHELA